MFEINSVAQEQIDKISEACKRINPKVAIWSLTYNHEPYIRDALEGFVMQKTDFPFVAIVHEDVSTDGTATILKEYAEKYPDIIFPIFEEENQYSKGNGSIENIMKKACEATDAKYVAICEGDDFWIDPYKLQIQSDFLDKHPDYGLVHSNAYEWFWGYGNRKLIYHERKIPSGKIYTNILKRNCIYSPSVLFRNSFIGKLRSECPNAPCLDRIVWMFISKNSKIGYIDKALVTYRILRKSATHGSVTTTYKFLIITTNQIINYLNEVKASKNEINIFYLERCRQLLKYAYLSGDSKSVYKYWNIIKNMDKQHSSDYAYYVLNKLKIPVKVINIIKTVKQKYTILLQSHKFYNLCGSGNKCLDFKLKN